MSDKPDLLPCPFCGGDGRDNGAAAARMFLVECTKCSALGPHYPSTDTAASAWNRRADTAASWKQWSTERPEPGARVVIIYEDGSGAFAAYVHDSGMTDGEGYDLEEYESDGAIWTELPEGFRFAFEATS